MPLAVEGGSEVRTRESFVSRSFVGVSCDTLDCSHHGVHVSVADVVAVADRLNVKVYASCRGFPDVCAWTYIMHCDGDTHGVYNRHVSQSLPVTTECDYLFSLCAGDGRRCSARCPRAHTRHSCQHLGENAVPALLEFRRRRDGRACLPDQDDLGTMQMLYGGERTCSRGRDHARAGECVPGLVRGRVCGRPLVETIHLPCRRRG